MKTGRHYDHYGWRYQDDIPAVGETLPSSKYWDGDQPTDDCKDGTCAVRIDAIRDLKSYRDLEDGCILLLGSDHVSSGDEPEWPNEIVMRDAVVLGIFPVSIIPAR